MTKLLSILSIAILLIACSEKKEKSNQIEASIDPKSTSGTEVETETKGPLTTVAFKEYKWDFKDISKKKGKVSHYFTFKNTGQNPLIISAVKPDCGCTAPVYPKEPIKPNQEDSILVEFNPQNFSGKINKGLTVYANIETPIRLTFEGEIVD